jgi:hypothetical protein
MAKKLFVLNLILVCLLMGSGYLCVTYSEYRMSIFYTLTIPSVLGIAICSFVLAVGTIDND